MTTATWDSATVTWDSPLVTWDGETFQGLASEWAAGDPIPLWLVLDPSLKWETSGATR